MIAGRFEGRTMQAAGMAPEGARVTLDPLVISDGARVPVTGGLSGIGRPVAPLERSARRGP